MVNSVCIYDFLWPCNWPCVRVSVGASVLLWIHSFSLCTLPYFVSVHNGIIIECIENENENVYSTMTTSNFDRNGKHVGSDRNTQVLCCSCCCCCRQINVY